mgnify:CR=1 FL=1
MSKNEKVIVFEEMCCLVVKNNNALEFVLNQTSRVAKNLFFCLYLIISKMSTKRPIINDDEKNPKKNKYDIMHDQFKDLFNKIKIHFEYAKAIGAPVALVETEDRSKIFFPNKPYTILERNGKNIHTCIQKIFGDILVNKESECGSEDDHCYLHDNTLAINKTKWSFWNIHTDTRLAMSDKQMHQIIEHNLFSGICYETHARII